MSRDPAKVKAYNKEYHKSAKRQEYLKKYRQSEIYKVKQKNRQQSDSYKLSQYLYQKKRHTEDLDYRLIRNLRKRLRTAIKNNYKSGSAVRDLGCTIEQLKIYLESQFLQGMTWDNWTKDGWHIDHIIPLSKFDLTDREQFLKANNYKNLQPMWARDNIIKSNN